jgi:hypothetical protein
VVLRVRMGRLSRRVVAGSTGRTVSSGRLSVAPVVRWLGQGEGRADCPASSVAQGQALDIRILRLGWPRMMRARFAAAGSAASSDRPWQDH